MDVVTDLIKMPFTATASLMSAVAELTRSLGSSTAGLIGLGGAGTGQPSLPVPVAQPIPVPAGPQFPPVREERATMLDLDLNDDMVKVVSWRILYTKPDEERVIDSGDDKIVSYRTTGDQWGGQIMTGYFLENQARVFAAYPELQREKNRRYVKFSYEVKARFPKEETYYERRQVEALESIAQTMG